MDRCIANRWLRGSTLALMTLAAACTMRVDDEPVDAETSGIADGMMRRVVIARMFQRDHWTLPAAQSYRPDLYPDLESRKIAYVCEALAYLQPTYVSGLVRLDAEQVITADSPQARIFNGVKACVRGKMPPGHEVKFDVVLNALHYTDPEYGVSGDKEGAQKLRGRLESAHAALAPDAWFFDFYTTPFNQPENDQGQKRHPEAMLRGIDWIHDKKPNKPRQLVGGNAWGTKVPGVTDFISITDKNGMPGVAELAAKIHGVPLLMHIQNDPHIPDSQGRRWNERGRDYRKRQLAEHVAGEELGYSYMFPVFFPLDKNFDSYNAVEDGNMMERICQHMGGTAKECAAAPEPADKAAPHP